MRQLDHFTQDNLKLVASDDAWNERRESSGVATPARNVTALNLILGCQVNAIYADNLPARNPVLAPTPSGDYHDLVLNGWIAGRQDFEKVSWRCEMVQSVYGNPLGKWLGVQVLEIFLLEKRSLSMFGRFNDSDAGSDGLLSAWVGFGRVPCSERGWMPYCLPCIVHFLTGPTVELSQICDILGYGTPDEPPLQPVRIAFDQAIHQLLNPSVPTG
ncbi:uncharacterized protein N7483_002513 [Penicillium malachiteum]|uniref:uncharacterized protein n=1 Tax=Penicillium malachiteum TaxID=1324776 RepID=UPI00254881E1|nr:uncharacterized protein N7483_002513 [Penicillium malachiteum]KAJ5737388.1 hypothetical protein N7483_002513 [Penicillium malachiteum]